MKSFEYNLEEGKTELNIEAELFFKLIDKKDKIISVHVFNYLTAAINFMDIRCGFIQQNHIPDKSNNLRLQPVNSAAKLLLNDYWLRLLYTRQLGHDSLSEDENDFF